MRTDVPTNRTNQRLWFLVLAVAIIATAAGTFAIVSLTSDRDAAQVEAKDANSEKRQVTEPAKDLANSVSKVCRAGGEDAQVLREAGLCGKASVTKEAVDDATGTTKQDQRPPAYRYLTLTDAELGPFARGFFTRYCAAGDRCQGDDGKTTRVTQAQIDAAVAQQLPSALEQACGGPCKGATGDTGTKGDTGDTGSQGPAGKDADPTPVAVAVANFTCSGGLSPVTYTLVFTDGHTEDHTCGELPPVEPTPTP